MRAGIRLGAKLVLGVALVALASNGSTWGGAPRATVAAVATAAETCSARVASLEWLARHQGGDGAWNPVSFGDHCGRPMCPGVGARDFEVVDTSVSMLALVGAGYTSMNRSSFRDRYTGATIRFGDVLGRARGWLLSGQNESGWLARSRAAPVLDQAAGLLALAGLAREEEGRVGALALTEPLQRAVAALESARCAGAGYGDRETTLWALLALGAAREVVRVDEPARAEASRWLAAGSVAAAELEGGKPLAVALLAEVLGGDAPDEGIVARGRAAILADLPVWSSLPGTGANDVLAWHRAALALGRTTRPRSDEWRTWSRSLIAALGAHQRLRRDGCLDGSWDPGEGAWDRAGGRVFVTAVSTLALEVAFRYEPADRLGGGPTPEEAGATRDR
jgi:hypothetical protein